MTEPLGKTQVTAGPGFSHPAPVALYPVRTDQYLEFDVEAAKPLVPDATYLAICLGCDVRPTFNVLKAYLRFRISEGPHQGTELYRAYRMQGRFIPGKGPGSGPRPKLKRSGDFFRMLSRVLNLPLNTKAHRVSYRELNGKLCRITTRTVKRDSKQQALLMHERYSVIHDVIGIEAG